MEERHSMDLFAKVEEVKTAQVHAWSDLWSDLLPRRDLQCTPSLHIVAACGLDPSDIPVVYV